MANNPFAQAVSVESISGPPSQSDYLGDRGFRLAAMGGALIIIVLLVYILFEIGGQAMPAILDYGLGFLVSTTWDVSRGEFGILPEIWGTLYSSLLALAIGGFFGITVAIFLTQGFLHGRLAAVFRTIVEMLAAIPSVVYGLWGIYVVIPAIRPIANWLHDVFGWFPLFGTSLSGPGLMPAVIVLSIMILPTVAAISQDALNLVPYKVKEAAYGMGTTRWEAILRVLVPTASRGIFGALVLGFGRALGETMALAMLEAGQSLRFALMPEKQDPDDVIRAGGAGAMQGLLDQAMPMVQLLWRRETEGKNFDSPERKAALDKDLRTAIAKIADPSIRHHYGDEIKNLRWQLFNPRRQGGARKPWRGRNAPEAARATTKSSALVSAGQGFEEYLHEAVILATLITHPELLHSALDALERLDCTTDDHRRLQGALLVHVDETDADALRAAISATIGPAPLENLFALRHVQICPSVAHPQDADKAALCLAEEVAKLTAMRGAAQEIEDALQDMDGLADEGLTWRLGQAAEARNRAGKSENDDKSEFDIGPNGARISRDERGAFESLLEQIGYGSNKPDAS